MFKPVLSILLSALSLSTYAALKPIPDNALGDLTGQAFITIDRHSQSNVDFTRINLGLDVNTLLTSDQVELGRYERAGEAAGSSDIKIGDFALGHINDSGNIEPFQIKDPFIEIAFDSNENLVGFRLGFNEAYGKLSGNIEYLTGNIEVSLYGTGSYLASQMNCAWWDIVCGGAKALVGGAWGNDEFAANAELVHGSGPQIGSLDPVRATHVGMPDGSKLSIPSGGGFTNFLLGLFSSNDCSLLSTQTCFPLSSYRTLDVGNTSTGETAKGMFLSFQANNMNWYDDGNATLAQKGAFMNIPNGGIRTSFPEAFSGIPRARTKYIDPYF